MSRPIALLMVLVLVLVISNSTLSSPCLVQAEGDNWEIRVLDSGLNATYISLASRGNSLALAYFDASRHMKLAHDRNADGDFDDIGEIQVIDDDGECGSWNSVAFGAGPAISYTGGDVDLRFAYDRNNDGDFSDPGEMQTVESEGHKGHCTSLAFGTGPAISHYDDVNRDLRLAYDRNDDGDFADDGEIQIVDSEFSVGPWGSLAFGDGPSISYVQLATPSWLMFARDANDDGDFADTTEIQTVASIERKYPPDNMYGTSLAFGLGPAIAYSSGDTDNRQLNLVYDRNDDGDFDDPGERRVVCTCGVRWPSLAFGPEGPAIAFYDYGDESIKFLYDRNDDGDFEDSGEIETVDVVGSAPEVHGALGCVFSPEGPAISYVDYTTGELKLAIRTGDADTHAPVVSDTSPPIGAIDVSVDTQVTATFSKAMDASTIDETTFTLDGGTVSGSLIYEATTKSAVFTPDSNLECGHEYTVTISGTVADLAANTLDGNDDGTSSGSPTDDYSWRFTTVEDVPSDAWSILVVDSDIGAVLGAYVSVAFGDGFAISYWDANRDLKFAYDRNNDMDFSESGEIQVVDGEGDVGAWSSVAFDTGPAVSYYDGTNIDLKFAYDRNDNGDFADPGEIQTVQSSGRVGRDTSLAFGAGPAISHYEDDSQDLLFAYDRNDDGDFDDPGEQQTVASEGNLGSGGTLAMGAGPAISYINYGANPKTVEFAYDRNNDGDFLDINEIQTVASTGTDSCIGNRASLAFGEGPAIGYCDSSTHSLKIAYDRNDDGDFNDTGESFVVDDTTDGRWPVMNFGPLGPAVAYYDPGSGTIKFGYDFNNDGDFDDPDEVETVDYIGISPSAYGTIGACFGPEGQPAVAYYDWTDGTLKLAVRTDYSHADWEQALAEKFAPILYLYGDGDEVLDYEPKAAEIMVDASVLKYHDTWNQSEDDMIVHPAPDLTDLALGWPGDNSWSGNTYLDDLAGNPADTGDSDYWQYYVENEALYPTTTYARVWDKGDRIILQYWFFYYFNHWPLSSDEDPSSNLPDRCRDWDDHEGDWECIELVFQPGATVMQILGSDLMPKWAVYSTHYCHQKTEWDSTAGESQWLKKVDTHPVVYVARGSHANFFQPDQNYDWTAYDLRLYWQEPADYEYVAPGSWIQGTDVLYGLNSSDSAVVEFHDSLNSDVVLVNDSEFDLREEHGWLGFAGHWGEVSRELSSGGWFPVPCHDEGANGPVLADNPAWTEPSSAFRDAFPPLHAKRFMAALEPINAQSTTPGLLFEVCDRYGNRVGANGVGQINVQIPGAEYWTYQPLAPQSQPAEPCASSDGGYQAIVIPGGDVSDQFTIRVEAIDSQDVDLTLVVGDQETGVQHKVHYSGISVIAGSVGEISITPGTDFVMAFDSDGDGIYESNILPTTDQSAPVEVWPVDETPPTPVDDLSVVDVSWNACTLEWTVPGDNGSEGTPSAYELRYSTYPMTEETWYSATHVLDEPRPKAGGENETFRVEGLSLGTTYYFGLMVGDEVPNWSDVSNIATVETATTAEVTIDLQAGWNMVSVPVQADDMLASTVFAGSVAVYTWDPESKSYISPDIIDPKCGYWVAVTEDKTITVTGTPVTEWICNIFQGWNMIGSAYGDTSDVSNLTTDADPDPLVRNAIYHWNPSNKSYESVSELKPGEGYWLATITGCELALPPPA